MPHSHGRRWRRRDRRLFAKSTIPSSGSRRSADILLVAPHRRYTRYVSEQDKSFVEGVLFITSSGTRIINYPKQHSDNMTAKHQATTEWLKPTVRIFKNMRNRMIQEGLVKEGTAPSYFIEGLLHNVPTDLEGPLQKPLSNAGVGLTALTTRTYFVQTDSTRLFAIASPRPGQCRVS